MMNLKRQSQFELFPGALDSASEQNKNPYQFKDLTLTQENIIVLSIVFLMVGLSFFAIGVERGKRVAHKTLVPQEQTMTAVSSPVDQLKQREVKSSVISQPVLKNQSQVQKPTLQATTEPVKKSVDQIVPAPSVATDIAKQKQGQYTIQVASFKSKVSAEKEATLLKKIGYEIYILSKGNHAVVCVGKFLGVDEAQKFLGRLKNRYGDCLVRRF